MANVAAGTSRQAQLVLRKALPILLRLLDSNENAAFKTDIVWTLANIAGDSADCRDKLLDANVHLIALKFLKETKNFDFEKHCVWLLSNLFRHVRGVKDVKIIAACVPTLLKYLHHEDCDILHNVCWSLKYIADRSPEERNLLIETDGVCQRLVDMIRFAMFFWFAHHDTQICF